MAWVRFTRDFDWNVGDPKDTVIAFRSGRAYSVKAACAASALAAKAAKRIAAPKRGVDPNAAAPAVTPPDAEA